VSAAVPDFVVIGSGPNGLVAACVLAKRGMRVLVLEAHPSRPGGAVASEEATLPGFVHDVGAAFFAFAGVSPAFRELRLEDLGLRWCHAEVESCHPAPDGSVASLVREPERNRHAFGSPRDEATLRRLSTWHRRVEPDVVDLLLRPVPSIGPALRLLPFDLPRLGRLLASSGRGLARRLFESEAARRVVPALSLHVDVGPDDCCGAGIGWMLAMTATSSGWAVPEGGAGSITGALVRLLERSGGAIELGSRAARVVVREGRARAVLDAAGRELEVGRGVLADTAAPALLLDLVARDHVPSRVVRRMERFPWGFGTFKMDWALDGRVAWRAEDARRAAVVHAGDSLDDLARFTHEVRAGRMPEHPYLVIGQQSVADPSRAPAGRHTLWAYSRVPSRPDGGWERWREPFADRIEARIEGLAPGFRRSILARRIVAPPELEAMDPNLVGGDLGGGSNAWNRQLVFRPVFPYFRHRTPVRGLYLCSSFAHPGPGVHGMCGYNAARIALADLG
jgi:phytoene dehydrogenase-like protein